MSKSEVIINDEKLKVTVLAGKAPLYRVLVKGKNKYSGIYSENEFWDFFLVFMVSNSPISWSKNE